MSERGIRNPVRDVVVLTYTRIIGIGTNLIYSMVLVRALTKYNYGVYSQAQIVISFCVTFLGLSLPNCINFFLPKAKSQDDRSRVISNIASLCILAGVIGALGIAFLAHPLALYFELDGLETVLYIGCTIPCWQLLSSIYDNTFVVLGRTKLVAIRRTLFSLLKVIVAVLLWLLQFSFYQFYFSIMIVEMVVGIYSVTSILCETKRNPFHLFNASFIKSAFVYSLPLALASTVGIISANLSKLIVSKQLGAEELALYTNMTQELPITIIATSIAAVGVPLVAQYHSEKRLGDILLLWNNSIELSFICTTWIVGIFIVLAPEVVTFLYSDKYITGVPIFRISSLVLLLRVIYFGMILNGTGHTRKILYSSIGSVVINIFLIFLLFPIAGVYGLTIATLLSTSSAGLFQLWMSRTIIKCSWKDIFPWKRLFVNVIQNVIAAGGSFLLAVFLRSRHSNIFVIIILVSLLWGGIIFCFSWKRILKLKNDLRI